MLRKLFRLKAAGYKKFQIPRLWSNAELRKFAHLFHGDIVNVSGWTDIDKEGKHYRDYFYNANEYWITNYNEKIKGLQHYKNEIFLDLEEELNPDLLKKYDVVFNHTTLEHIYETRIAFRNICNISKDVVIIVVPYIQQIHGIGYSDYWRFTPHTMAKMYEENGLKLRYCAANGKDKASIYLFCIGYRDEKWDSSIPSRFDLRIDPSKDLYGNTFQNVIGSRVI
jgi:hypothetical protein